MNFQPPIVSQERRRLKNSNTPIGIGSNNAPLLGVILGSVFFVVGAVSAGFTLWNLPTSIPLFLQSGYVISLGVGVFFLIVGLIIFASTVDSLLVRRKLQDGRRWHPGEPAMEDFPWNPRGFYPPHWTPVFKGLAFAIGMTLFLSIFHIVFFSQGNIPWLVWLIIAVFDVVLLFLWFSFFYRVGYAMKFGGSWLEYLQFPYRPNTSVTLRWHSGHGITSVAKGSFALRCIEEWYDVVGSGKNRHRQLVHEEIWSSTLHLDGFSRLSYNESCDLQFLLPPDAATTRLNQERPVFWVLDVSFDLEGIDFGERYLVPIYASN